jgi:16S rRNA processing protein RimM
MAGEPRASEGELNVARVVGAHGVAGALRVTLYDTRSQSLRVGLNVAVRSSDGTEKLRSEITRVAPKPGSAIVRIWLADVSGRSDADALRECELWIDRSALPVLEEDEYYMADVVGLDVLEDGRAIGTVVGVRDNRVQDLLEIESKLSNGQAVQWLLPAVSEIIVDVDERGVHVSVPPGMGPEQVTGEDA